MEFPIPSVTGQSSKPVTIAPNASDGGLLLRWGLFDPRELARFKELLEKPGTVGMSKEEFEQMWVRKSLRETLSTVEECVGKLEGSMEDVNELFNSHRDKLSKMNDALTAMMMALKEETMATTLALSTRIEELEGELASC
ncbi:hypothetical protein J1N35_033553 [Gossypium stocksii]|uniref:Uncharacterized protein n=1 Tax=Gossypium stocksii TaxID=47602 RepID=A0A9D3UQA5_9ROSI|nr:hypothetical protein J1N35_033553 [Gossypium stocksii]